MRRIAALAVVLLLAACGASDSFKGEFVRCRVTAEGIETRADSGVEKADQLEDPEVGDDYQSTAGCIDGDDQID